MPMAIPLSTEQLSIVGQQPQQQTQSQYVCKFCGKRYAYASSLYVHTRNHTNERPFKCRYVRSLNQFRLIDKIFSATRRLRIRATWWFITEFTQARSRMFRSNEFKSYPWHFRFSCPTCGKSYAQKVGLKIHLEQCGNGVNNLSVPITSISSTRQSSESPINVDTDSDASYGALSRRNSIAIPSDAFKCNA